jgi:putative transposase
MPNHVHIIIAPSDVDGLRRTFADVRRRYTGYINIRMRVTGHLWQSRVGSVVMDEEHFGTCMKKLEHSGLSFCS